MIDEPQTLPCPVLDLKRMDELKKILAELMASVKPSHRLEIAARAFGFATHAALRARLKEGPVLISEICIDDTIAFCGKFGANISKEDVTPAIINTLLALGDEAVLR